MRELDTQNHTRSINRLWCRMRGGRRCNSVFSGFTLVELLVVCVLFPLILLVLTMLMAAVAESQVRSLGYADLDQNLQLVSAWLPRDMYAASSVLTPATNGASGAVLVLQQSGGQVRYSVTNQRLVRQDAQGADWLTSDQVRVTNFTVQRLGNPLGKPSVKIELALVATASAQQPISRTLETVYTIR